MSGQRIDHTPADFRQFWSDRRAGAAEAWQMQRTGVDLPNPAAVYEELRLTASDGAVLRARYIRPAKGGPTPTVLMFHDYGRGIRGWHHMTRFAALGYGVLALENRALRFDVTAGAAEGAEGLLLTQLFTDALTLAHTALCLPEVDRGRLMTWGEGFGGGLALAAAAVFPCEKCAVLNPMPADFRTVWRMDCGGEFYSGIRSHFRDADPTHQGEETFFRTLDYVDCVHFAPLVQGSLLLGTGMMDAVSPPEAQDALYAGAVCEKRQIRYPKYGHERINFFENEQLKFFL